MAFPPRCDPASGPGPGRGSAGRRGRRAGFTLVEILVTVTIISVLAALLVPTVQKLRLRTKTSVIIGDFRTFAAAFDTYAQEHGTWPAEAAVGTMPTGMADRLNATAWLRPTPMGGRYNWENNQLHFGVRYRAAIAISATGAAPLPLDVNQLLDLDRRGDDGNLLGGSFRIGSSLNPLFVVQP